MLWGEAGRKFSQIIIASFRETLKPCGAIFLSGIFSHGNAKSEKYY